MFIQGRIRRYVFWAEYNAFCRYYGGPTLPWFRRNILPSAEEYGEPTLPTFRRNVLPSLDITEDLDCRRFGGNIALFWVYYERLTLPTFRTKILPSSGDI